MIKLPKFLGKEGRERRLQRGKAVTKTLKWDHIGALQKPLLKVRQPIQPTFGEHSGNMQRTFGAHSVNIRSTFREHSGNIWSTFREHSGNIRSTFREHSGNIWSTLKEH
jgi:hypothetical protein